MVKRLAMAARVTTIPGEEPLFQSSFLRSPETQLYVGGMQMEKAAASIAVASEELAESRAQLQSSINELMVMSDKIQKTLHQQIQDVRATRFALVSETAQMMDSLREVRKFFLDNSHQEEVTKLRAFVSLCNDLRLLATDGSLDKIIEAILRLAVKQ